MEVRINLNESVKFKLSEFGRTIETTEVDGYGILINFRDGSVLSYAASDGGYSHFDLYESTEEYLEDE